MKHIRNNRERGSAMVEFAMSAFVLWFLFAGIFQFGYTFYTYNVLKLAVANAAEYGSRLDYDTGNTSPYTDALRNMVVYGDATAGTTPVLTGLTRPVFETGLAVCCDNNRFDSLLALMARERGER